MLDHRGRLLLTALSFAGLPTEAGGAAPEIQTLRSWLDSWSGLGAVEQGMARQGFDLQLTRYANEGWRATFFVTGVAHSIDGGSAWKPKPWAAVQTAAKDTLRTAAGTSCAANSQ